jgi:hypothetical protein
LSRGNQISGLRWTFVIMLIPLAASALYLFRAMRTYPTDVATAGIVSRQSPLDPPPGGANYTPPDQFRP